MRSTVLRESELPHLPDDWELSAVEALAEINPEVLGAGTPQGFRFRYIDLSAVEKGRIDWSLVRETVFREAPSRARRLVRGGDVLFGTVRPALQSHAPIPADEPGPLVASTGFAVIRARPEQADSRFLFNSVLSYLFSLQARRTEVGSNYPAVNESDVRAFLVPHPDLTEQRRIAAILDTLDDAIRRTEQVIAKLQQMQRGLLHDLLTRGVDEHGDLRPLPEDAPHLYKDSPLGRIPMRWEVGTVYDVQPSDRQAILTGPFGADLGSRDFVADGVPVLRIGNVQWGYLDLTDLQYVTESKARTLGRYRVREGDLLFARQGATTGRNALADARANDDLINYHIIRVAVDQARAHPTFLHACFNSELLKRQVDREKGRGTREGVSTRTIAGFVFWLPPIEEQRRVSEILQLHDARVASDKAAALALREVRMGLLHDLLTGRVRVPLPAEATA